MLYEVITEWRMEQQHIIPVIHQHLYRITGGGQSPLTVANDEFVIEARRLRPMEKTFDGEAFIKSYNFV